MRPVALVIDGARIEAAWWDAPAPDGRAPTLVLLHEGLGSVSLWRDFPAALARATDCPVFAYSRLGYGNSDPVPLPRPLSYMHDEARALLPRVLAAAGIGRRILIGHSDGASIAAIHAGEDGAPDLLALVLIAPHFFVEQIGLDSIAAITDDYENGDLRARLARHHAHVEIAFRGWSGAWLDPDFRAWNIEAIARGIRIPTLLLQGAQDAYGTEQQLRAAEHAIAAPVQIVLFPDARHSPHAETPAATCEAIAGFVRNVILRPA